MSQGPRLITDCIEQYLGSARLTLLRQGVGATDVEPGGSATLHPGDRAVVAEHDRVQLPVPDTAPRRGRHVVSTVRLTPSQTLRAKAHHRLPRLVTEPIRKSELDAVEVHGLASIEIDGCEWQTKDPGGRNRRWDDVFA